MAKEIERKYLVNMALLATLPKGLRIVQGYIPTRDLTAVRVRIKGSCAYLTIKSANQGMTRQEFEYEIPVEDAQQMLHELCGDTLIDKTRYEIPMGNHIWELDVFEGTNKGLVVAEIELTNENESFDLPNWITEEVTADERYYNSNLIQQPFINW